MCRAALRQLRVAAGQTEHRVHRGQRRADPVRCAGGVIEAFYLEVQRLAVVHRDQRIAHDFRGIPAQRITDREVVVQRLAHLLAARHHHRVVQPVPGEGLRTRVGLRLGDLVLMMREDEIVAATMDIEPHAQVLQRHR